MFSHDFNFGFERRIISKELRILSPPAKEYNGGISDSANFFRVFDYLYSDEVWDRETMFSQLAKRSIRGLVSGLPRRWCRRRCVFS